MRSSSRCKNKFYTSSWCISGEKLNLLENPRKCYTNKQITFISDPELPEANSESNNKSRKTTALLQLNQKDYEGANNVLNKQLKRIYETVEVDDFKRILNNFYITCAYRQLPRLNAGDVLKTIDAENIYEQFFGQYYKFVEDTANES